MSCSYTPHWCIDCAQITKIGEPNMGFRMLQACVGGFIEANSNDVIVAIHSMNSILSFPKRNMVFPNTLHPYTAYSVT